MKKFNFVFFLLLSLCLYFAQGALSQIPSDNETLQFKEHEFSRLIHDLSWTTGDKAAKEELKKLGDKDDRVIERLSAILVNKDWDQGIYQDFDYSDTERQHLL